MADKNKLSSTETIKMASDGLRGTLKESLKDEITGAVREDDKALIKFHGMYEQDDRDRREERAAKKLDRLYSFMIRLRLPAGILTAKQWQACHDIAGKNSTGVIKITSRQTIQLHGLVKPKIKDTIKAFSEAKLNSIATCGDINRNVLCSANPSQSRAHEQVIAYAQKINDLLLPKTHGYYEIWLDEEKIADKKQEEDPLYQDRYMPRKFKIAIAIPPNNDVDVFGNDIGLIAIVENDELKGFNIAIGGGLATTHGNPETYARVGTVIGFTDTEQKTLKAVYEILTVQRDFGNRSDRKMARLKYTVDTLGVEKFKEEVEKRAGFKLEEPRPASFTERRDYYGWMKDHKNNWHYTVYVENGRVADEEVAIKTALLEIAKTDKCNFIFTTNQNIIIANVAEKDKKAVNDILERFRIIQHTDNASVARKNSIACVALPTCPLALAEGQRYMPSLISKIEALLAKYELESDNMIIRMTGCPNGCARSYLAEIGFIGSGPGKYNMHLGGDRIGQRLNKLYKENMDEMAILGHLDGLFSIYKKDRQKAETFGDFAIRKQWVN